jgi:hypothetical protein
MPARGKKSPGIVLYWVTSRDEDTTELLDSHSFPTMKDAKRYRLDYEERVDPPGHICRVDIEVILTGEQPPRFKR